MELYNTMVILVLCLLFQPFADASMHDTRQDHKPRRTRKSTSTTTAKPEGDLKPEVQYNKNEIKYDPIEVRYQVQQYPNLVGEQNPVHQPSNSDVNTPHITQNLQQQQVNLQQVHMQQPLLQLPAATPQLHPFHQQQIIQMIQRALYATQRHNQPTAMIIIAQPAPFPQQPARPIYNNGPYAGQTRPLLSYYHQNSQQGKYQPIQETTPQHINQYIDQSHLPNQYIVQPDLSNQAPQNYQIVPASAIHYQPSLAIPTSMPTTHMSPVQPVEAYPNHLSQIANIAQLAAQQYSSPAQQYSKPAQQYAGSAQQYNGPYQEYTGLAQAYPRHANEYLGAAHQFQFEAEARGNNKGGRNDQVDVPVRSLPPIITGFENFSPEQQEKIKEQLSAHFGGPLKLLAEKENNGQYQGNSNSDFVPSQQVKEGRSARSSSIMSLAKIKSQKM